MESGYDQCLVREYVLFELSAMGKIFFSDQSLVLDNLFAFFSCVEFWQVIFNIIFFPH